MPGTYRLVIKGHDGNQIGVLSAYKSLTYEKLQNRVGEGVLVANYGVTDATDALLDELVEDIILEVQRHPDITDPALDWYVDWMGFCEPPEETTTEVATERNTWRFRHINRLLEQNLVQPKLDGVIWYEGQGYSLDRELFTGSPRNIMRQVVRQHCVEAFDTSRRLPALFVEDNEADPTPVVGWPGWVFDEVLDPNIEGVMSSIVWQDEIVIGFEDYGGLWEVQRSADGDTWTPEYNWYTPWAMATFDDTGGERLYIGYGNYGWSPYYSGVRRSAVGAFGGWGAAWTANTPYQLVCSLAVHNGRLYAGTGYGTYFTGGQYLSRGRIWRCLANDGTTWAEVHDGNPGGVGIADDKHLVVEGMISWNGHIYAGVTHGSYWGGDQWSSHVPDARARVIRSASGDLGTWTTVFEAYGAYLSEKQPDGTYVATRQPLNGACCFCVFGSYLYVGIGDRICPRSRDGRIYRTADGETWEQVFGAVDGNVVLAPGEEREDPQFAAPGVTWLQAFGGALWAGCGGPKPGDGEIWYSTDGTNWILSFDQRGYESQTCHTLVGHQGNLYAGFGYSPLTPGDNFSGGYGYVWRMTEDGWDPPDWSQESGGNWVSVFSVLQGVADSTKDVEGGTDFGIVPTDLGGALQEFIFQARTPWGADRRSTSGDPTIFGINRGNMANPVYRKLKGKRPTVVYGLGTGQGDSRSIIEMKNPIAEADSPWARRETAVDIQGVDTSGELWQQARKIREGDGPKEEFTFDILETPSTRYGVEWDVGTLVSAVYRGSSHHCKITGATVRLGSNPVVEAIDTEILLLETV